MRWLPRWRLSPVLPTSRLAAILSAILVVAACASGAGPSQSIAAALPTVTPLPTSEPSPAPTPSPTPRVTPLIVKVTPIPGAPDSGVVVKLTTKSAYWSVNQLDAPAGKVWKVQIGVLDGVGHNFIVASGPQVAERIFVSPAFGLGVKGTFPYDVPALPAGSYLFICAFHSGTMTGTLTIR